MRDAFVVDGSETEVWLGHLGGESFRLHAGDDAHVVSLVAEPGVPGAFVLEIDGRRVPVIVARRGDELYIYMEGAGHAVRHLHPLARVAGGANDVAADVVRAPMPGSAVSVSVAPGDSVARGQALLVMESMKMETTITASRDGVVEAVSAVVGQPFEKDAVLVRFRSGEAA